MAKYQISEIPDLDPAEFDLYRAGRRTGEWFYQIIEDGVLDLAHTHGWVPIGKTFHNRILSSTDVPCELAVMYQWRTDPKEMIWFHV